MAIQHTKQIGKQTQEKGTYLHKDNWEVMKPFVHFAFKAIAIIGGVLLTIVKLVPKALEHKHEDSKDDKVIKI